MTTYVLSVVGSDRPGLTEALSAAVLMAGGNWLQSHLSRLGGIYVGSVLVELEVAGEEALRTAVRDVDAKGLEVRITPAAGRDAPAGEVVRLSLVGQDRPGIVHQVTSLVSSLDANIEALETRISVEAHSGTSLFHMDTTVRLPSGLTALDVRAALEDLSGEIMVDVLAD